MFFYPKNFIFLCLFGNLIAVNSMAATLRGSVTDESEPVVMAEVIVINATSNALVSSKFTDVNGSYQFELPNGVYNLNVSKTSFAGMWVNNIVLENSGVTKNITLLPQEFVNEQIVPDPDGCD